MDFHPTDSDDGGGDGPITEREEIERRFWETVGDIYSGRRIIIWFTGIMAVLSVVVSLLLPNWYKASARLILPSGGGSGLLSAALGDLASVATNLFGGGGDYVRYLAILDSRSAFDAAVDHFDLIEVYDVADSETAHQDAADLLRDNVEFAIDDKYDYLSISAWDKDPVRAAAIANYFVRFLNETNSRLSANTAASFRRYAEMRYDEAMTALDSVLDATQRFQEDYGVFDVTAQTEVFFQQLGELRARTVEAEIQYEVLREQLGPENARVEALREVAEAANRKYLAALRGGERLLPVPQDKVPEVIRALTNLEREKTLQVTILEVVAPILEQARFEERKAVEAVQVVDKAVPPVEKSRPYRALICVVTTLTAFGLSVLFVVVSSWWKSNGATLAERVASARVVGERIPQKEAGEQL